MLQSRNTRSKLAMTIAAALASGSLFGACEIRLHNAIVDGSKNFVFTLLDPALFSNLFDDVFDTQG